MLTVKFISLYVFVYLLFICFYVYILSGVHILNIGFLLSQYLLARKRLQMKLV